MADFNLAVVMQTTKPPKFSGYIYTVCDITIFLSQSCCEEMKILTDNLHKTLMEAKELSCRMSEFREGLRAQISSILSAPPARKAPPPLPPPPPAAAAPQHVPDLIDLESSHEQTNNTSS